MDTKDNALNLMHKCQIFLANINNSILKINHSVIVREALILEITTSSKYLINLIEKYPTYTPWFEDELFYRPILNYLIILDGIQSCLIAFNNSGSFFKFVNKEMNQDVIKQWLYEMKSITNQLNNITLALENHKGNESTNKELNKVQNAFHSSLGEMDKISIKFNNNKETKKQMINEINNIKLGDKQLINKYELDKKEVIKIDQQEDKINSKLVAKKYRGKRVLERRYYGINESTLLKLKKEAAMVSKLSECSYIIKIYGLWINKKEVGLVMEYCKRGSFKQLIVNNEDKLKYSNQIKLNWMKQLLEAITYLHELNIIHRNLNLNHLLLDNQNNLKLTGFEFSKEVDLHQTNLNITEDFTELIFIAPESVNQSLWSMESDVYSTSLLLWSIYNFKLPFQSILSSLGYAKFIRNPYYEDTSNLPNNLVDLFYKGWNFDIKKRSKAYDLLNELETIIYKQNNRYIGDLDDFGIIDLSSSKLFWAELNPEKLNDNNPSKKIIELQKELRDAKQEEDLLNTEIEVKSNQAKVIKIDNINSIQSNNNIVIRAPLLVRNEQVSKKPSFESLNSEEKEILYDESITIESAVKLYHDNQRTKAYEQFIELSKFGEIEAFYYLGLYYYWGYKNILKDINKAINYLELSATSGHAKSLDFLGIHYYQLAQLNNKDEVYYKKAKNYFDKAAQKGDKNSLFHLGTCYIKGQGTPIDTKKGLQLVNQAAILGNVEAKKALMNLDRLKK